MFTVTTYLFQIVVIMITAGVFACGLYGMVCLQMEFRPEWMLDPDSESEKTYFS